MRGLQILAVVMIWWFWCSLQDIVGIGAEPLKFSQLQDFLIEYLRCIPGGLQSQWLLHTSPPLQPLTLRADPVSISSYTGYHFLNFLELQACVYIRMFISYIYQWNPTRSPSAANSEGSKCLPIHPGPWPFCQALSACHAAASQPRAQDMIALGCQISPKSIAVMWNAWYLNTETWGLTGLTI